MSLSHYGREYDFLNVNLSSFLAWMTDTIWHCMGIKNFYSVKYFMISAVSSIYFFILATVYTLLRQLALCFSYVGVHSFPSWLVWGRYQVYTHCFFLEIFVRKFKRGNQQVLVQNWVKNVVINKCSLSKNFKNGPKLQL